MLINLFYIKKSSRLGASLFLDHFLSVFNIDAFWLYIVRQGYTLEGKTAFDGRCSSDLYTLNASCTI